MVVAALATLLFAFSMIVLLRRKLASGTEEVQRQLAQAELMRLRLSDSERKFRELAELTSDVPKTSLWNL